VLAFDEAPLYARLLGNLPSARPRNSFSHSGATSASNILPLPAPAPFHFLLKVHLADGVSGQCGVPLPRGHFDAGVTLEFLVPLSRDGVTLLHPQSKLPIRVHFVVQLSSALASQAQQQQRTQPAGTGAKKF